MYEIKWRIVENPYKTIFHNPGCISGVHFFHISSRFVFRILEVSNKPQFHTIQSVLTSGKKTSNKTRWWILNKILPDFADIYTLNYLDFYLLTIA